MSEPSSDLEIAVLQLVEATGCDPSTAADIVDSIARYTAMQMQGCLPAGWGLRDGGRA